MRSAALLMVLACSSILAAQGVAFVNIERVVLEYKKTADITTQLENRLKQNTEQVRLKRQGLQQKLEALELSDAPALDRLQKERDLAIERVEIDLQEKGALLQQERELVEHLKKVYKEVQREVAAIGASKGLSAVLLLSNEELGGRTRNDVWAGIQLRSVLWRDEKLDLTAEVVQRLNR
ncbi:MAG: OmpH family outer membrane protein [Planctomycetes bacterium]|nr:OmpH family outer membrane protein [Planctomycetota bacterium]